MPVSLASSICSPGFDCLFLLSAFASSTVCLDPLLPYQLLVRIGSQRSRDDSFALPVSPVSSIRLPGFLLPLPSAYFCFPHRVLRSGPLSDLFGRGAINSTKTLLGIAHALTVNSSGFESSYELAVHLGVGKHAGQFLCQKIRATMGRIAKEEQNNFVWKRGSFIEVDEASMRASRVNCPKGCKNPSCGNHPHGYYRLLHHRFQVQNSQCA